MRRTTQHIFKLIFITLFIVGCNDDDFHENKNEVKLGIVSNKISFEEFKKYNKAFEKFKSVESSKKSISKIITDTVNKFTIETDDGVMLQYANLHSFTFPITRTVPTNKLENLVISLKNDGTYKARILKYNLTLQEHQDLENGQLKTIQNPIETIIIDNFDMNQIMVDFCTETTETIVVGCGHIGVDGDSFHGLYNISDWINCKSSQKPRIYTITRITCISDAYSGGGGGGGSSSDTGGGGSDGNYSGDFPSAETNPEDYEEGVSLPVTTDIGDSDFPQTPCEELTNKDQDSTFNTKMEELKLKAGNQNFESAYALYQNAGEGFIVGNEFTGDPNGVEGGREVTLTLNSSVLATPANCIGFTHCHLDGGTTFKVFSFSDVFALAQLANISTRPKEEFAIYVTTNSGTFALKINNKILLKSKKDMMEIGYNEFEREFEGLVKRDFSYEKQKLGFMKFINSMPLAVGNPGIDMYEKVNGTWNKLGLSSNGNSVTSTPCN